MFTDLHRKPGLPGIYGLDTEGREVSIPDEAGKPEEEWNPDYAELVAAGLVPEAVEHPVLPRTFTFLEFMDLFTEAEQLAIAGAAMTDVATKLWYDRAVGAQFIDLADARLTSGMQAMVTAGLLTSARRNRVLKGLAPTA